MFRPLKTPRLQPPYLQGANILTTKEGLVKLADFGVAAKVGEGEGYVVWRSLGAWEVGG